MSQGGQQERPKNHTLQIELTQPGEVVSRRQYPIPINGRRDIQPVIEGLIKYGLLDPCMSPYNTPVLLVKKLDGSFLRKRHKGYTIIDGISHSLCEGSRLPNSWSVQSCELYALNQALKLFKGQEATIYSDSKYAYRVVHTFGKKWTEWGFINSKGKELVHGEFIKQVLESLLLLREVAVVHVKTYQKGSCIEAMDNRLADKAAKQVSFQKEIRLFNWILSIPKVTLRPLFTKEDENE